MFRSLTMLSVLCSLVACGGASQSAVTEPAAPATATTVYPGETTDDQDSRTFTNSSDTENASTRMAATPQPVLAATVIPKGSEIAEQDEVYTDAPSDVAAAPATAAVEASGLASRVLKRGTGARHPVATDKVTVHYSGWTTDGNMFDSSVTRNRPAAFPLNRLIPGWTEGIQLMVEGEIRRFWIPGNLAYGNSPGKPQGMLVFDVWLLEIE